MYTRMHSNSHVSMIDAFPKPGADKQKGPDDLNTQWQERVRTMSQLQTTPENIPNLRKTLGEMQGLLAQMEAKAGGTTETHQEIIKTLPPDLKLYSAQFIGRNRQGQLLFQELDGQRLIVEPDGKKIPEPATFLESRKAWGVERYNKHRLTTEKEDPLETQ
jgi:hypothetical protein